MIVKCSHCQQMFSEKIFVSHECGELPLKDCKRIEVVYFMDVSYAKNKLMNGMGIDGTLYTFEVVPRKPIPLMAPLNRRFLTEESQKDETDKDFTEPICRYWCVGGFSAKFFRVVYVG